MPVSKFLFFPPKLLVPDDPRRPALLASWRLALPCGCCCFLGARVDTERMGAEFVACCAAHAAGDLDRISETLAQAGVSGMRAAVDMATRLMEAE